MRRGRRIYTCVKFFDEKDFRIGYTCVSLLIAPLEASSLLRPPSYDPETDRAQPAPTSEIGAEKKVAVQEISS